MKPTVVLTHWVHPEVLQSLEEECTVIPNLSRDSLTAHELRARAAEADALMVFMPDRIDMAFLDECPKLKVVSAALKGYDNFDVDACTRKGIWFSIVQEALTAPTAELALALMLGLGRKVRQGDTKVRSGRFEGWRPTLYGTGLHGSTVGLLGMGAIGQAIADRLQGFGCQILYTDPNPLSLAHDQRLGAEQTSLHELLQQSDFVVISVPYMQTTEHLIGASQLERIKAGALLINVGRGSVVDEEAITTALREGPLGGYASDVFEFEDWARPDRPLQIHPDLLDPSLPTLFTPHLGSAVDTVRREIAMEAAHNILEALRGQRPKGAINQPTAATIDD